MAYQPQPATLAQIDALIARYPQPRSAMLMILHAIQKEQGLLSPEAQQWVADRLGLEPIQVRQVVTFYPYFREHPIGRRHIRVCRTLSCALRGAYALRDQICAAFATAPDAISPDGRVTVEFAECLASCGTAPVVMVDDDLHENLDEARVHALCGHIKQEPAGAAGGTTGCQSGASGTAAAADPTARVPPVGTIPATIRPPHPKERRIILRHADQPDYDPSLACYLRHGGYAELRQALAMQPDAIVAEVVASGLRGRGGAGFPAGMKWRFLDRKSGKPVYLICNADESEPGTFKDRQIIHKDPHQLIEGMVITAFAIGAAQAFIYIREEMPHGARILEQAIAEARAQGFVGPDILGSGYGVEIVVHRGAAAYICGEETGLIESLEGKRAYPRIKPPYFPAALGLYQCPTIVNNVETLCNVKHIVGMGGAAYAAIGRPNNTGTRIWCLSGHVRNPGYFEVETGRVTYGELIHELGGGLFEGRRLQAVIPGGSSAKVWRAGERFRGALPGGKTFDWGIDDIPLDFDGPVAAGSMSGSGAVIVIDDSVDIVEVLANINAFYAHESCGQCTPCREGSLWMKKITTRMVNGQARREDTKLLASIGEQVAGRTICAHGEACSWPTQSFVEKFQDKFLEKAEEDPDKARRRAFRLV
jgi:NADH-quinone oxidoreductase subunit F